ncbi:MAG: hypothetical protein ACXVFQ_11195 [Solirubrobacteraceae bacterium]
MRIAQYRTTAPVWLGSSLMGVIEWFLIWRVPTLFAGSFRAAYEVPPSATKSAT